MSRCSEKAKPVAITREEVDQLLLRLEAVVPASDFALVRSIVISYVELSALLESREVTLARLRKLLFGVSSEQTDKVFDEAAKAKPKPEDSEPKEPRKGHGRNGASRYSGAGINKIPHADLKKGDRCPDCERGKLYGNIDPAVWVRVVGQAPLSATIYEMERLRCNLCAKVHQAAPPPGIGDKKYDASAAAMIALSRYGAGIPFYRMSALERNFGIPISPSVQWEISEEAAEEIAPAYAALVEVAAAGDVVYNDDTPMTVLNIKKEAEAAAKEAKPGDPKVRKATVTSGIVSTRDGRRIALYFTGRQNAGENLRDVLKLRPSEAEPPIQMCDALRVNMPSDLKTVLSNCLAHGRRQFVDLHTSFPEECFHVLTELGLVYKVDAEAKLRKLAPKDRLALHQQKSGPVMAALKNRLDSWIQDQMVEPNSGLGKAIQYFRTRWDRFTLFLRQPGAPLDNNLCEQALKKAVLHRKNSLFYRSERGAEVGDLFMSLIHTAELSDVPAFPYLVALLKNVKAVHENPSAWLPWNYPGSPAAAQPSHGDTS